MSGRRSNNRKMLTNGRNAVTEQYWNLPYNTVRSEAWRQMSGSTIKVLMELRCRFNGGNNGKITLSLDEAARLLRLGKATVVRALAELQEKGFIVETRAGHWYGRMATEWAITDKPLNGNPPSNAWRQWRPEKQKSVPERTVNTPDMVRVRTDDQNYGPPQNPSGAKMPSNMVRVRTANTTTPSGADPANAEASDLRAVRSEGATGRSGDHEADASPVALSEVAAKIVNRARPTGSTGQDGILPDSPPASRRRTAPGPEG